MKYLMMIKGNAESEAGKLPSQELIDTMMKYNEELAKAGVLVDLNGLKSTAHGFKVNFSGKGATVTDGPFTEANEVVAGYWVIKVKSRDEAIAWAKKAPLSDPDGGDGGELELREIFEMEEIAPQYVVDQAKEIEKELAKNR